MDRTLIDCEPAVLIFNGGTVVFKDGISVKIEDSVQKTPTSVVENAGDTWDDAIVKISGTPCGEWENLTRLYPYGSYRRGQNIFGADVAAVIHTTSGRKITVPSAAVSKLADLDVAPDKSLFASAVELTGVRKKDATWADADSLYKEEAAAFASWAAFDAAAILKVNAAAAWESAAAPFNNIETEEGWKVQFGLNLKWRKNSALGTFQAHFVGLTAMAKCMPQNVSIPDIIAAHPVQGSGRRGARVASGNNLVLTGDGGSPVITLTSAALRGPGYEFGDEKLRVGEIGFEAQRTYSAGVPQPLFTLA